MNRVRLSWSIAALLLVTAAVTDAAAQAADAAQLRVLFADTIAELKSATGGARVAVARGDVDPISFVVLHALPEARAELVRMLENQRIGKQLGAPVLPSGTTSLVAKGDSPSILGFGLEHGLVTGTKTGNSVTLRGNLYGLVEGAVRGIGLPPSDRVEAQLLRRLSFSASFEPTSSDADADDLLDDADRLSAWTARFDFINRRHAQDRFHRTAWDVFIRGAGQTLAGATDTAKATLNDDPAFVQWRTETVAAVQKASEEQLEDVYLARLSAFRALTLAPATRAAFATAAVAYTGYLKQRQNVLDGIAKAPVVTLEFTHSRPRDEQRTSNFRLIADGPVIGGSITGNLAVTLFNGDKPPDAGDVRDVQGAFQYDFTLKSGNPAGPPVLVSLALKGQWLAEDVMLKDALFPNTQGTVVTGQLKVTVPVGESPIRIPVSITYSNRTEFIKEKVVRGQVGLTFDVDSLIAAAGVRR